MKMWSITAILGVALVMMMSAASFGEGGNGAPQPKVTRGEISKVDATSLVLVRKKESTSTEITFALDASTKVTIDGQAASAADLKPGQKAAVTHDADNKASAVAVGSAPSKKEGSGGEKGKE